MKTKAKNVVFLNAIKVFQIAMNELKNHDKMLLKWSKNLLYKQLKVSDLGQTLIYLLAKSLKLLCVAA